MTPLPDLMKTRFGEGAWLSEVPGLRWGEVDVRLGTPVVHNTKSLCLPVDRGCGLGVSPTRPTMGYTCVFCHLSPGLALFPFKS